MKGPWTISHNYAGGKTFIQVYRLRDTSETDHAGNREIYPELFETDEEAVAVAKELNEKEVRK